MCLEVVSLGLSRDKGVYLPLFLFRRMTVSSLLSSPLFDAELILLGPVGFLAGTPVGIDLGADLGELAGS